MARPRISVVVPPRSSIATRSSSKTSSQPPSPSSSSSLLLSLPAELRLMIYKLVLVPEPRRVINAVYVPSCTCATTTAVATSGGTTTRSTASTQILLRRVSGSSRVYLQILSVCQSIRQEALPVFLSQNHFLFDDPIDFANNFLREIRPDMRSQLQHLVLCISLSKGLSSAEARRRLRGLERMIRSYKKDLVALKTLTISLQVPSQCLHRYHPVKDARFARELMAARWLLEEKQVGIRKCAASLNRKMLKGYKQSAAIHHSRVKLGSRNESVVCSYVVHIRKI